MVTRVNRKVYNLWALRPARFYLNAYPNTPLTSLGCSFAQGRLFVVIPAKAGISLSLIILVLT